MIIHEKESPDRDLSFRMGSCAAELIFRSHYSMLGLDLKKEKEKEKERIKIA